MGASSQDVDRARAFYTRISRVYDRLADADERTAREAGLRLLDAQPGEQVLEIGYGTGHALASLAEAVGTQGHVFGVDISDGMRRVAAQRLRASGLEGRCSLEVAAIPPLPWPDRQFDSAFLSFTLELFPADTIPLVLSDTRRALKPAGRLCVVSMRALTAGEEETFAERAYKWMHRHFPHLVDCAPIDLPGLLGESGYSVECERRLTIWSMPVSVCLARAPAS